MAEDDPDQGQRSMTASLIPAALPEISHPALPTPASTQQDSAETQPGCGSKMVTKEENDPPSHTYIKTEKDMKDDVTNGSSAPLHTLPVAISTNEAMDKNRADSGDHTDSDHDFEEDSASSSGETSDADERMSEDGDYSHSDTRKRRRNRDSDADEDEDEDDEEDEDENEEGADDINPNKIPNRSNDFSKEIASNRSNRARNDPAAAKQKSKLKKSVSEIEQLADFDLDRLGFDNVYEDANKVSGLEDQKYVDSDIAKSKEVLLQQVMEDVPDEHMESAKADLARLSLAFDIWGCEITATAAGLLIPGVTTPIMMHQFLTAAFISQREKSINGPQGGIIANHMGLGKTLAVLAVIANQPISQRNRTKDKKVKFGATLVIAREDILDQWDEQTVEHIVYRKGKNKKVRGIGKVVKYKTAVAKFSEKTSQGRKELDAELRSADIVLATYDDISASHSDALPQRSKAGNSIREGMGFLHRYVWGRIVVDEAQRMRNPKSKFATACFDLEAKHHWLVTGTPVVNAAKDLFSYFKFMGYPGLTTKSDFDKVYCLQDDERSVTLLKELLGRFMIRFKLGDIIFGRKLAEMPPPEEPCIETLEFSPLERMVYDRVESSFQKLASEKNGNEKLHTHGTMIVRLRQLTDNPLFLRAVAAHLNVIDFNALYDAKDSIALNRELSKEEKDIHKGIDALLSGPVLDVMNKNIKCVKCQGPPSDPQVTDCEHILCKSCIKRLHSVASHRKKRADSNRENAFSCPKCNQLVKYYEKCKDYIAPKLSPFDAMDLPKNLLKQLQDHQSRMSTKYFPSTKIFGMQKVVREWLQADPHAKIIVFAQFNDTINQLEHACEQNNWAYCTYTGSGKSDTRTANLEAFKDKDSGVQILLAGLKCGSEGLDLSVASCVCIMEPWWNQAIETQAFCRVYRIGQTKVCKLTSLIVKDTYDEDIVRLKEAKEKNMCTVMDAKLQFLMEHLDIVDEDGKAKVKGAEYDDLDALATIEARPKHELKRTRNRKI